MSRDFSALFVDGRCVVCHQPRSEEGYEHHAARHLATAEAVTDSRVIQGTRVERVIPNTGHDEQFRSQADRAKCNVRALPRSVFTRPMDKKLRRIVREQIKKQGGR